MLAIIALALGMQADDGPANAPSVSPPQPKVITNPSWARRPNAEDFARFFPDKAGRAAASGFTVLKCAVEVAGLLNPCDISFEFPPNHGFAQATLKMASRFKLNPQTIDGVPVEGGTIVIPINFVARGKGPVAFRSASFDVQVAGIEAGHAEVFCVVSWPQTFDRCKVLQAKPKAVGSFALKAASKLKPDPSFPNGLHVVIPFEFKPRTSPTPPDPAKN